MEAGQRWKLSCWLCSMAHTCCVCLCVSLREVVSAFSFDLNLRVETCTRLTHLLRLEAFLRHQVSMAADLSFFPFGLPHEQIEAAREAEVKREEQELKREQNAAKTKKGGKKAAKKEEKIDYMQHLTMLLRPMASSAFQLLNLPLHLGADPCWQSALSHPDTFQPGHQPVVPMASARLPVSSLRFLLRLLLEQMKVAEDHSHSPLAAVINTRPERDEDGLVDRDPPPDAHSSEQMSPVELVRSLMPVLPMLGSALLALTQHDAASKAADGEDKSDDVEAHGVAAEVIEDSIDALVGVCRLLFEDPALQAEPRVQQRAIAAFVKAIEGFDQRKPKKSKNKNAAAAAPEESKESDQMELDDDSAPAAVAAAASAAAASSQSSAVSAGAGAALVPGSWLHSCRSVINLLDKSIVAAGTAMARVVVMLETLEIVLAVAKTHDPVHVTALEERLSSIAWACLTREWSDVSFKKSNVGKIVRIYLQTQVDVAKGCTELLDQMQRILTATMEWQGPGDL